MNNKNVILQTVVLLISVYLYSADAHANDALIQQIRNQCSTNAKACKALTCNMGSGLSLITENHLLGHLRKANEELTKAIEAQEAEYGRIKNENDTNKSKLKNAIETEKQLAQAVKELSVFDLGDIINAESGASEQGSMAKQIETLASTIEQLQKSVDFAQNASPTWSVSVAQFKKSVSDLKDAVDTRQAVLSLKSKLTTKTESLPLYLYNDFVAIGKAQGETYKEISAILKEYKDGAFSALKNLSEVVVFNLRRKGYSNGETDVRFVLIFDSGGRFLRASVSVPEGWGDYKSSPEKANQTISEFNDRLMDSLKGRNIQSLTTYGLSEIFDYAYGMNFGPAILSGMNYESFASQYYIPIK